MIDLMPLNCCFPQIPVGVQAFKQHLPFADAVHRRLFGTHLRLTFLFGMSSTVSWHAGCRMHARTNRWRNALQQT